MILTLRTPPPRHACSYHLEKGTVGSDSTNPGNQAKAGNGERGCDRIGWDGMWKKRKTKGGSYCGG